MKVLKFDEFSKEVDNFETIEAEPIVRDWLESISLPFEAHFNNIEAFEFRSRSGFIAHSHNRGGLDLFAESHVSALIGSGEHCGLSIEKWAQKSWDDAAKAIKEDHPDLKKDSDEFFDKQYDFCSDCYEGIAWRVRVMYEGNGVLTVYAGYDFDAPYYRWSNGADFEKTIKFKTLSGLKRQLEALTSKVEQSQNKKKEEKKK